MDFARTGTEGLDDILGGGLPRGHLYLVEGDPGAGKTTLGLRFLLEGAKNGESALYITLSESEEELREVAAAHEWSLEGIDVFELKPSQQAASADLSLFHPSEVDLGEVMKTVLDEVARVKPSRVVFDSLSELRLIAQQPLRYRRQILALKQYFAGTGATVVLLDDRTTDQNDRQLASLAHGVVSLDQLSPLYGAERRRLRIAKLRGGKYRGGYHDFIITTGGLRVFPRLVAADRRQLSEAEVVRCGSPGIDQLLGGGLTRGTSTLILGPAGSGKSTLTCIFACAAAERGEPCDLYLFDENAGTFFHRTEGLGLATRKHAKSGKMRVEQVDPAELSPGEFAHRVRAGVETRGTRVVVIDSINGYMNAMPEESFLLIQLHELLTFLAQEEVLTFLVTAQHGVLGAGMQTPIDISYVADTVILTRYFEAEGQVRNALSVVKKRNGAHEKTIREFTLSKGGIRLGEPLDKFHGVLTGVPRYTGGRTELMEETEGNG